MLSIPHPLASPVPPLSPPSSEAAEAESCDAHVRLSDLRAQLEATRREHELQAATQARIQVVPLPCYQRWAVFRAFLPQWGTIYVFFKCDLSVSPAFVCLCSLPFVVLLCVFVFFWVFGASGLRT